MIDEWNQSYLGLFLESLDCENDNMIMSRFDRRKLMERRPIRSNNAIRIIIFIAVFFVL